jgi:hypothetical protein
MTKLPPDFVAWVERLCDEGERLADKGDHVNAVQRFRAAWNLIPEPKAEYEGAFSILGAIGDACFLGGDWQGCRDAMQRAVKEWEEAIENPFVRLRLGQSLFELGELREAANWMAPAYLMEGKTLFASDKPKYLEFVKRQLQPPPGGWPEGW